MKIPLHKIPADVRCKKLSCCHIALKLSVFLFAKIIHLSKVYQVIFSGWCLSKVEYAGTDFPSPVHTLYLYAYTNTYRLCIIRYYNQSCAYFVAFLTTDSVGPISTDANGKMVTRTVHIYGNFWLREITISSVMLADTWRDANQYLALPLSWLLWNSLEPAKIGMKCSLKKEN